MIQYVIIALLLIFYISPVFILIGSVIALTIRSEYTGSFDKNNFDKNKNNKLTYLYIGDQISESKIAERLPNWRAVAIETHPKYVDLVIATGKSLSDKRLFSIKSRLKCRMDSKQLTDKVNFHHYMKEIAPELIANTIEVTPDMVLPPGVWMIRANWGWGGKAAAVATNNDELRVIYEKFTRDNPFKAPAKIIASEYIIDPMLYFIPGQSEGYKFHLRIYMMCVVLEDGSRYLSVLRNGLIIPAHEPYSRADWSNPDVHDTHGRDNRGLGRFPRDLPNGEDLLLQIISALKKSVVPLLPKISVYTESRNGYEMLGADIMFTSSGELKIIEINDNPGLSWLSAHPEGAEAEREILDFLFGVAFSKVFYQAGNHDLEIALFPDE